MPKRQAFTILEVLITITLLGFLATITIIAINPQKSITEARDAKIREIVEESRSAIINYSINNNGDLPLVGGNPLPLVTAETIVSNGVLLPSVDGLIPDYLIILETEMQDISVYVGLFAGDVPVTAAFLSGGDLYISAQNNFVIQVSTTPTPTATVVPSSCSISYTVTNQWQGGFNAEVVITNDSGDDIVGWDVDLAFSGDQAVTNAWNVFWEQNGSNFSAENQGYNATITGNGGTQSFGFGATFSGNNYGPLNDEITLNGTPCNTTITTFDTPPPVIIESCSVSYQIGGQWGNNYTASVTVTNNGTENINGWVLDWDFPEDQLITSIWNAGYSQNGQSVTANDLTYNAQIPPNGGTQSFGFQATFGSQNSSIPSTAFTLNGNQCE